MEKLDELVRAMMEFYRGDAKQVQHFTKVYAYAHWIARREGLDSAAMEVLDAAALTHDIGIKVAMEKYGHSSWALQEQEGPPAAGAMMTELGFDPQVIARVCYLIGHHHTYTRIDGLDYQILVEADFLVNFQEGNRPMSTLPQVYADIFRTGTGREFMGRMYDYSPGEAL